MSRTPQDPRRPLPRPSASKLPASARYPAPRPNGAARRPAPSEAARKPARRQRFDKRWLVFVPVFFLIALISMYASIACNMAPPEQIILGRKGLEILDREGRVIYTVSDEPGSSRIIPLEEVSADLINATIATEDANFWDNPGINIRGLTRAAYENVAFWESGGLGRGSGGSSITQQLAKNLYIPPDERATRSPLRKLKETMIAFELSRRYDKQDIMQWYLSNIFYGQGAYGIESASYRYFNKPPVELTLPEAALLAGIPRSPIYYDPLTNFEAAKERQEEVLGLMVRHDLLSEEDAAAAMNEEIVLREGRIPGEQDTTTDDVAIHFALYVRDLVPNLIGSQDAAKQLRITTTLDYDLQVQADEIVKENLGVFEGRYGASNGALVAIDPKTGEILAMVGSHDFNRDDISGQVNNALSLNQPGSTMKPITYLAAFLKGWAPATIVADEPLQIASGSDSTFTLTNADNRYRGTVPVRVALGSSLNVPAVKALRFAGLENVYNLARNLGITSFKDVENYGDAFTLGGADTTLLDMTYAYSVFANQGVQSGMNSVLDLPNGSRDLDPIAILKIETVDGKTLWEAKTQQDRVVAANASYLITNILADDSARVSGFGANSALNLRSRPAAVKTGSSDATRDAWAIGYTPQLVTGVWVGNADNTPMPGGTSTLLAAPIWNEFMAVAHQGLPVQQFTVPEGVRTVRVCLETGESPPGNNCRTVVDEVFIGNAPRVTPTPEATNTPEVTPTPERGSPTPTTPTTTPSPRPGTPSPTATQPQQQTPTRTPTRPATEVPATPTRPPATQPPAQTSTPQQQATPQSQSEEDEED